MNQTNNRYLQTGGMINYIRKHVIPFVVTAHFLSISMVLFGLSPFTNQVSAWCEVDAGTFSSNETYTEGCMLGNLSEIEKLPQDRVLSASGYEQKINDCTNGNAGGVDRGLGEVTVSGPELKARCANAIVSCQKYAIDIADCTPNNLKTIAGTECNSGRLSGNGNDDCQRLKEMNGAHIDDIAGTVCSGESDNAMGLKATNDCKSTVNSKCLQGILNDDGTVRGNNFEDGKKCATDESRKAAQSREVCDARGGIWIDKQYDDPIDGNSDVSQGCKNNYTDIINEPACKAAGGKWEVTSKQGDPTTDYSCVDPLNADPCGRGGGQPNANGECPDGSKPNGQGTAAPPGGTGTERATSTCGQARVNLLACGDKGGAEAFTNVLKIILQVLTSIVGIAAVGGLAYAAVTYARAQDNASVTGEAITLIRNVVIGILLYGFLIALAGWLIPGLSII
ncbi:MAG: hypothetical protein WAW80_05070 [Candidatus Saccharimonadales bacterium]